MGAACDLLTKRQAPSARLRATSSTSLMPWVTMTFWLQEVTFFSTLLKAELFVTCKSCWKWKAGGCFHKQRDSGLLTAELQLKPRSMSFSSFWRLHGLTQPQIHRWKDPLCLWDIAYLIFKWVFPIPYYMQIFQLIILPVRKFQHWFLCVSLPSLDKISAGNSVLVSFPFAE